MIKYKDKFSGISNLSLTKIWLVVFIYSVCTAFLVQFVILPYVFPSLDNGEGLIKDMDPALFNRIAVQLYDKIKTQGWGAWELYPGENGQSIAGVVAAIYALTIPKPWVLIPFNAALHATSSLLLFLIISFFISDRKKCLLAILPFVFYPTATLWFTQIHKDGVFITGIFSFALGWIKLSRTQEWERKWFSSLQGYILIFAGVFLVWLMRPYCIKMLFSVAILISIILSIALLSKINLSSKSLFRGLCAVLLVWIPLTLIHPFLREQPFGLSIFAAKHSQQHQQPQEPPELQKPQQPAVDGHWASRFKKNIENELKEDLNTIVFKRVGSARTGGMSLIDSNVSFKRAVDYLIYLPRLIQISFLAPFPNMWFTEGVTLESTIMRRVSAFEMMGVYFFLPFLPFAIWDLRKRVDFWIIMLFFASMLLLFGFSIINIGTFYRMRYGFLMPFVSFGIVGFVLFLQKLRKKSDCQ